MHRSDLYVQRTINMTNKYKKMSDVDLTVSEITRDNISIGHSHTADIAIFCEI